MKKTITFSEKINAAIVTKIYSKIVFVLFMLFSTYVMQAATITCGIWYTASKNVRGFVPAIDVTAVIATTGNAFIIYTDNDCILNFSVSIVKTLSTVTTAHDPISLWGTATIIKGVNLAFVNTRTLDSSTTIKTGANLNKTGGIYKQSFILKNTTQVKIINNFLKINKFNSP